MASTSSQKLISKSINQVERMTRVDSGVPKYEMVLSVISNYCRGHTCRAGDNNLIGTARPVGLLQDADVSISDATPRDEHRALKVTNRRRGPSLFECTLLTI